MTAFLDCWLIECFKCHAFSGSERAESTGAKGTRLKEGANIEDHNENGHTPLMEAASAGHVEVARVLLEYGAGINTHSNEFKESALTLACYKGQNFDIVCSFYYNV